MDNRDPEHPKRREFTSGERKFLVVVLGTASLFTFVLVGIAALSFVFSSLGDSITTDSTTTSAEVRGDSQTSASPGRGNDGDGNGDGFGELGSGIDPLFITYVCDDRQNSDYAEALDRWGYLTLAGKAVICLEFNNQNPEFVIRQQELLDNQIRRGEFSEFSHVKSLHEDSPDAFYRNAAMDGGLDPNNPFGSFRFDSMTYSGADLLLLANIGEDQIPSIARLHTGIVNWAASNARAPFGFSNAGQVLSPTLTQGDNHLSRLLDNANDYQVQFELVYGVVHAMHYPSRTRWDLLESTLQRVYELYLTSPGDLWFHEWLVRNPDVFLGDFWPAEDWTLPAND